MRDCCLGLALCGPTVLAGILTSSGTDSKSTIFRHDAEAVVVRRGERLLRGATDIEDYAAEVPPVNGTMLIFPNGPDTWHGHKRFTGKRYSIQLNYMTTDAKARSELRRHRVSAFIKRLAPV